MQLLKILVGNDLKNSPATQKNNEHNENKPFLKGLFPFLLEKSGESLPKETKDQQDPKAETWMPPLPVMLVPVKESPDESLNDHKLADKKEEKPAEVSDKPQIAPPPASTLLAEPAPTIVEQLQALASFSLPAKQNTPERNGKGQLQAEPTQAIRIPTKEGASELPVSMEQKPDSQKAALKEFLETIPLPKDFSKLLKKEVTVTKVNLAEMQKEAVHEKENQTSVVWLDKAVKEAARTDQSSEAIPLKKLDKELAAQIEQLQKWQVKQSHAYLTLTPAALGKVDVLVKKTPEQILLHIEYEKQQVKPKIEQMMHDMQQRMKERGIDVLVSLSEKQVPKEEAAQPNLFDRRDSGQGKKDEQREQQKQKQDEEQVEKGQEDYEEAT